MNADTHSFEESIAKQLGQRGVGPLAAFLLRMHLPVTGLLAHAVMFGEPFLDVCNINATPLREVLQDRDAVQRLILKLEYPDERKND
jgi:hypothetical protein